MVAELQEPLGLQAACESTVTWGMAGERIDPAPRRRRRRRGEVHSSRCLLKAAGRLLGAGETSPAGPPCPSHRRPDSVSPKMLVLKPHCIEYSSGWRHHIPA